MKNINENISRVKSIMGLITESDIIYAYAKGSDTYDYKKEDGKFYISKKDEFKYKEVTDPNVIKAIKEKYIPDSLTIDSPTNFTENQLKFWKIFLRDYKLSIIAASITVNSDGLIDYASVDTKKDNVKIEWTFKNDGSLHTWTNNKAQFIKIVDDKIVFQDEKFSDLKNPENIDRPSQEKKGINPSEEYIKFNAFSSIADDIYRDLIEDKISNVSFNGIGSVYYNDNNELNYIYFVIKIDGKNGAIIIDENGVYLEVDFVQVKPIWNDKVLKYRPFNATEKIKKNEWMKTQPELKLESFQIRFKQLI
jgi:hypothetical protein